MLNRSVRAVSRNLLYIYISIFFSFDLILCRAQLAAGELIILCRTYVLSIILSKVQTDGTGNGYGGGGGRYGGDGGGGGGGGYTPGYSGTGTCE